MDKLVKVQKDRGLAPFCDFSSFMGEWVFPALSYIFSEPRLNPYRHRSRLLTNLWR
jgi:hypothetical protein